jgi:type II secretory pathway pseudopilin PulG
MKTHRHILGLTLIEIVIVVGIIMLLSTMIIKLTGRLDNKAKEDELASMFTLLETAMQEYHQYWNSFPDPNQSPYLTPSAALYGQLYSTPPCRSIIERIREPMVQNNPAAVNMPQIYDPWGSILNYKFSAGDNFPKLTSAGPDKIFGTKDDIAYK